MARVELLRNSWKFESFFLKSLKNQQWSRHYCCFTPGIIPKHSESSNNARWRILFFGTDEFAIESLKRLQQEYRSKRLLERLEVVTAYQGEESAVIKYAQDHEIKAHHWPIKNSLENFDIGLVVSFGHLIPSRIIQSFPLGMINVHASLLPRWRGAAPIIYALINGDSVTGVTIMKIAPKKFDVGEILEQREVRIHEHETQTELHKRLASTGGDLLIETLKKLPDVIDTGRPQPSENVTYAPKIQKSISIVKWDERTAREVYNLQRALTGIFPLKTTFQGKLVTIFGVKLFNQFRKDRHYSKSNPGMVLYNKQDNLLMVQCKNDSWVSIENISIPGKRKMSAKDFNNGFIKSRSIEVAYFGGEHEFNVNKSTVVIEN